MKFLIIIPLVIGLYSQAIAVNPDTCELYTNASVLSLYENCLVELEFGASGKVYVHHFLKTDDKTNLKKFENWLRENGFTVEYSKEMFVFERPFTYPDFEDFFEEITQIWDIRLQLNLAECTDSGRGFGSRPFINEETSKP